MNPRLERLFCRILLCAFAAFTAYVSAYHEPWRDEADTWLMARDLTLPAIWSMAAHSGTPILWYVILTPFAKLGAPFWIQQVLNGLFVTAAMGLVLLRSPLPLLMRLAVLTNFVIAGEYASVARHYSLGFSLAVAAALTFPRERSTGKPLAALLIAMLANVTTHYFMIAAVLMALWLVHRPADGERKSHLRTGAIAAVGLLAAMIQLYPRAGGQFAPTVIGTFNYALIPQLIRESLSITAESPWHLAVVWATYPLLAIGISLRPRLTAAMLAMIALPMSISVLKYYSGIRHSGTLYVGAVTALVLYYNQTGGVQPGGHTLQRAARRLGIVCASLCSAMTLHYIAFFVGYEVTHSYSEARDMGVYLKEHDLETRTIAAFPAAQASAILPYLPNTRFWYPGIEAFGTHMNWDDAYMQGMKIPVETALARIDAALPSLAPASPLLLITNMPLPGPHDSLYRLLYQTPGKLWRAGDERYYLYERL